MALDFFAGCVGGCAGVIVGHPLDTVKVMMQVQGGRGGVIGCMKNVIAKDSFFGLYRGVTSPMGGVAFVNAIVFGAYGNVQRRFSDSDSLKTHAASGAVAGFLQSFVCSPVELAKTRLQLGVEGKAGSGPIACLADIARREGARGLFRGLGLTALRDTPAFSCYFVAYETLARTPDGGPPGSFRTLMAGGLAGMASWLITVPIDSVKSRIQADGMEGPRQYSGAYDCLKKSVKSEGPNFLVRGMSAALLRAFPTNAACFWAVNFCMNFSSPHGLYSFASLAEGKHCDSHYVAHAYKSLVVTSSFSEHICPIDIADLHDEFKSDLGVLCRCLLAVPMKIGIVKEANIPS